LPAAEARLHRWRTAAALPAAPNADKLLAEVRGVLADDLDTPSALAAVDRWAGGALDAPTKDGDPDAPGTVSRLVDALLGVAL
jgi:L-cysteine:1D-myo-inositol 2-amino-2-deoxy-alpha-D-glucopyranoside ligase